MPAGAITGPGPGGTLGAFIAKLNAAGDRILYSGRISGNAVACGTGSACFLSLRNISGDAIALDSTGNAYIAGNANVTDLPTTDGVLAPRGIGAWVARINASGTKMDYLTCLGAANYVAAPYASPGNAAADLAVDAIGNGYVAGKTNDPKFPATRGALQPTYAGPANPPPTGPGPAFDAFVAKLNPQGTAMAYATFLGGAGEDAATGIALDSAGSAYVSGATDSLDFPVTAGAPRGRDFIATPSRGRSTPLSPPETHLQPHHVSSHGPKNPNPMPSDSLPRSAHPPRDQRASRSTAFGDASRRSYHKLSNCPFESSTVEG